MGALYKHPHPLVRFLWPVFCVLVAFFQDSLEPLLPQLVPASWGFSSSAVFLYFVLYKVIVPIHFIETLVALRLCEKREVTNTIFWAGHVFVYGVPYLKFLYRHEVVKKNN